MMTMMTMILIDTLADGLKGSELEIAIGKTKPVEKETKMSLWWLCCM